MNSAKLNIAMLAITFMLIADVTSSSLCDQSFVVHCKTEGPQGLLFFDVIIGGACGDNTSYILSLEQDNSKVWSRRADYYAPDSPFVALSGHSLEKEKLLKESNGQYMFNDSAFVTLPVYDSTFQRKFFRLCHNGSCDASRWNRECPVNCKDLPQFSGVSAKLIYTYPGGIYKNYTFSEVIYYPKSSYLVIVINQPLKAIGGDTNHGMLVFHLY